MIISNDYSTPILIDDLDSPIKSNYLSNFTDQPKPDSRGDVT